MSEKLGLGQIITTEQFKDAIHVAVAPVVAAQILHPGCHVEMRNGKAVPTQAASVGVVDPFLRADVLEGQTFWLFLHPGSITSLRHDWTHPAFPATATPVAGGVSVLKERARVRLEVTASNFGWTLEQMLARCAAWIASGAWMNHGNDDGMDLPDDFWMNYEDYTGTTVPDDRRKNYFSCSC